LVRTFAPEANLITSMSFAETCHYAEALKSIQTFKSQYSESYRWLYTWNKGLPGTANLYPVLVDYMSKKKSVPDKIATEWLRSPVFQAYQEELNLVLDERQITPEFMSAIAKFYRSTPRKAKFVRSMSDLLQVDRKASEGLEATLLTRVNSDLRTRTRQMLLALADNMENSQLVVADIYNFVGDKILADNIPSVYKTANGKMKKPEKYSGASGWDWGPAPTTDNPHAEVWEDELGYLQATLSNDCNRR
jgi:hypothetical protein